MSFNLQEFLGKVKAAAARRRAEERRAVARAKRRGRLVKVPRVRVRRRATRGAGGCIAMGRRQRLHFQQHRGGWRGDEYSLRGERGRVIGSNMLSGDCRGRLEEWKIEACRHGRSKFDNLIVHNSLSLPGGHTLTDAQWINVAEVWLKLIGAERCSFVAIRHDDTDNQHIHLIWSRVLPDARGGRAGLVDMGNSFYRFREAAHETADQLLGGRWTQRETDAPVAPTTAAVSAQRRAERRQTPAPWINPERIREVLAESVTYGQFTTVLQRRGIQVTLLTRPTNGQVTGLLFRNDQAVETLAGSSLSRDLSWPAVQRRIEFNRQQHEQRLSQQQRASQAQHHRPQMPRERG